MEVMNWFYVQKPNKTKIQLKIRMLNLVIPFGTFWYSMVKQGERIKKQHMAAPRSWLPSIYCILLLIRCQKLLVDKLCIM